ncbi:MAG: polysaccharide biosynthesis/export family protein [Myxococcota bacterium]
MRRIIVLVFIIPAVSGCLLFGKGESVPNPPQFIDLSTIGGSTTLGPGDIFEVKVYGEPDLSGIFRVSSDGFVNFPLIGKIKVEGLPAIKVEEIIISKLKDGYLKDPQVSVFIKEYNSKKIFVFGEVQKPGTFIYEDNMTIIQAITIAGGFTKLADKNKVSVTRIENNEEKRIYLPVEDIGKGKEKNFFLKPGDIIFVPESFF